MQALKVFLLCAVFSSGICDDLTNLAQGNPEIAQEPIASLDIAATSYETAFIKMLVALILILLLLMIFSNKLNQKKTVYMLTHFIFMIIVVSV